MKNFDLPLSARWKNNRWIYPIINLFSKELDIKKVAKKLKFLKKKFIFKIDITTKNLMKLISYSTSNICYKFNLIIKCVEYISMKYLYIVGKKKQVKNLGLSDWSETQ